MKAILKSMCAVAAIAAFLAPGLAQAQSIIDDASAVTRLNQYIANPTNDFDAAWWSELESELKPLESLPVEQVEQAQLQNVIFFAINHTEDVNLTSTGPQLYKIFKEHPDDRVRMTALTALHAVENDAEMFKLLREVKKEHSTQVRKHMVRVLNDYYANRYEADSPMLKHAELLNGQ